MTHRKPDGDTLAARLAVNVVADMNRAVERAGIRQKELAERLGVTESRVSQILNGDGNLRVATVARVFAALGFEARLDVVPLSADSPVLLRPIDRRSSDGGE